MFQRVTDSAVLAAFSMLYSCAVLLLKRRTKAPRRPVYVVNAQPAGRHI